MNYWVYHNIFATVVAAYWDDGFNFVTLGLENYFLDINAVVTRDVNYQGQDVHNGYKNLDLMFCMLLQDLLANKVTWSFTSP